MKPRSDKRAGRRARPPLDRQALDELAIGYVGRYATTRARLRQYLQRKLRERGWDGAAAPPVDAVVEAVAARGYVDDAAFASARAASLGRRGYGERRVAVALRAAGVETDDAEEAREQARGRAIETALHFARRRRLGPFSADPPDHDQRRRAFAAMVRAGHAPDVVRRVLDVAPGELPDLDTL